VVDGKKFEDVFTRFQTIDESDRHTAAGLRYA